MEARWQKFLAVKAELDAEWKRDAEARLAAIAAEVDRDTRIELLNAKHDRQEADLLADHAATDRVAKKLVEEYLRLDLKFNRRRFLKVGERIQAEDAAADNAKLRARGAVRGTMNRREVEF
jgi:hypothetical protein